MINTTLSNHDDSRHVASEIGSPSRFTRPRYSSYYKQSYQNNSVRNEAGWNFVDNALLEKPILMDDRPIKC